MLALSLTIEAAVDNVLLEDLAGHQPGSSSDGDHSALGYLLLFVALYKWLIVSYFCRTRLSWKRTGQLCCAKVEYVLSHLSDHNPCCPKRKARYFQCAKRRERERRRRQQLLQRSLQESGGEPSSSGLSDSASASATAAAAQSGETCVCPFSRAAQVYKLHLPPPLPLCEKNRSRASSVGDEQEAEERGEEEEEDLHRPQDDDDTDEEVPNLVEETDDSDSEPTSRRRKDNHSNDDDGVVCEPSLASDSASSRPSALTASSSSLTFRPVSFAPPTPLIDLARMQQWKLMLENGRITRRGAKYRDIDGLSALHWACSGGPPLEVVQALLDAYPSAIKKLDKEGSTPLHFATHYAASVPVVDALLKTYPKAASKRDKHGRSPLFHAVDKSSCVKVWRLLVNADPSTILLPCLPPSSRQGAESAVVTANTRLSVLDRASAVRTPLFLAWIKVVSNRKARTTCQGRYWEKALYLLESAWRHQEALPTTAPDPTPFQFLCAAIRLDLYLPEQVIPLALQVDPDQVREPEPATGLLPLSVAASVVPHAPHRGRTLLQLLLNAHPAAAREDGRLRRSALSHALTSGKTWHTGGIRELWQAHPDALRECDVTTALPPALLAAAAASGATDEDQPDLVEDKEGADATEVATLLRDCLDPFRFLTPKQQERLVLAGAPIGRHSPIGGLNPALEGLNTVFELFRADPAASLPSKSPAKSITPSALHLPPLELARLAATAA